jgi:DNA polymerase epsilon subunit 1
MPPNRGSFGLSSSRGRGRGSFRSNYRGSGAFRGGRGSGRGTSRPAENATAQREDDGTQLAERFERVTLSDEIDEKLGFSRVQEGLRKEGWLINMHPVSNATSSRAQLMSHFCIMEMVRLW